MEDIIINILTAIVFIGFFVFAYLLIVLFIGIIADIKQKVLLKAEYNGKNIIVKRSFGKTELIVDNEVVDIHKSILEFGYSLRSKISEEKYVIFIHMPKISKSHMYLKVDEEVIAYKTRNI